MYDLLSSWSPRERKLLFLLLLSLFFTVSLLIYILLNDAGTELEAGPSIDQITSAPEEQQKNNVPGDKEDENQPMGDNRQSMEKMMVVDIKGAVQNPGVYTLPLNSRLFELIKLAGGLTENADQNQVNLAGSLRDGMAIIIPEKGDPLSLNSPSVKTSTIFENPVMENGQTSGYSQGKVNLNTASKTELETLPGIGPSKAEAILRYREERGFQRVEDLLNVNGIGEKTFEKLKDLVIVY
ncbi:helix-hairpin-helix domain-containing protein [Microaerobacter geothermalis]|uniref:helix-hairpin-helix domain-containing protein n=1 Tax=Microaerobacter geothermalis TaxID=674972 RepID=UPI001F2E7C51|nr:helix-hairpin-helix domain-containing protein [Microaerobacter geothermalis]MCF6092897.1 helix-hairpin-helix domain-containing protein [Microaerobacter geothermalis]